MGRSQAFRWDCFLSVCGCSLSDLLFSLKMCLDMFHQILRSQMTLQNADIKNLKKGVRMFLLLLADHSNDMSHKPCVVELFSHGRLWHFCSTVAAWC